MGPNAARAASSAVGSNSSLLARAAQQQQQRVQQAMMATEEENPGNDDGLQSALHASSMEQKERLRAEQKNAAVLRDALVTSKKTPVPGVLMPFNNTLNSEFYQRYRQPGTTATDGGRSAASQATTPTAAAAVAPLTTTPKGSAKKKLPLGRAAAD